MAIRLFQKLKKRIQRRRKRTKTSSHHPTTNDQPIPTSYTASNSYYSSNYISDSSSLSIHSSSRTYDSYTTMTSSMSKQELEGTLLPPSASAPPLNEDEDSNIIVATAVSAIPVDYFHYNNNNNGQQDDQQQQQQPLNDAEIPTATNLLSYNEAVIASPNEQARAVTHQTNFGTDMGRIRSSEERDNIKKGQRESLAKNYHEKQAVERANQEMKERKRMDKFLGKNSNVLMRDSNTNDCIEERNTSGTKVVSVEAVSSQKKKTGGGEYEVQEYDVVEYSGSDYDSTYEYKSVYDS